MVYCGQLRSTEKSLCSFLVSRIYMCTCMYHYINMSENNIHKHCMIIINTHTYTRICMGLQVVSFIWQYVIFTNRLSNDFINLFLKVFALFTKLPFLISLKKYVIHIYCKSNCQYFGYDYKNGMLVIILLDLIKRW